jgi:hypothetical protein
MHRLASTPAKLALLAALILALAGVGDALDVRGVGFPLRPSMLSSNAFPQYSFADLTGAGLFRDSASPTQIGLKAGSLGIYASDGATRWMEFADGLPGPRFPLNGGFALSAANAQSGNPGANFIEFYVDESTNRVGAAPPDCVFVVRLSTGVEINAVTLVTDGGCP